MTELTHEQQERFELIIDNIINNCLTQQERLNITLHDGKIQNLKEQFEKAKANNSFLSMQIIHRQMNARINELLCDYAGRRLQSLVENGDIARFMAKDQHEEFDRLRGRIAVLMDVLDTAFLDIAQLLDQNGVPAKVTMLREVISARKAIDKWAKDTIPIMRTDASTLLCEESDKLYDYVSDRTDVLMRKALRKLSKQNKQ